MNKCLEVAEMFLSSIGRIPITCFPIGSGLINKTYCVEDALNMRYVLQQVNTEVFKKPLVLEANLNLLLKGFKSHDEGCVLPENLACKGKRMINVNGTYWRMYHYIEGEVFDTTNDSFIAGLASGALAEFHCQGKDVLLNDFQECIPNFTDFEYRLKSLRHALENGIPDRISTSKDFYLELRQHFYLVDSYLKVERTLPVRLIHGDPKISNFIFNTSCNQINSIIDLDTIGKGTVLYDFGDMVRSFANKSKENETVRGFLLNKEVLCSIYENYLNKTQDILTDLEKNNLGLGGSMVTLVQSIRFYTDYLIGDIYYQTDSEMENLVRARNQFQLFKELSEVKYWGLNKK